MREFNEGLEAADFRYFIAAGKSRAQMDKYSVAAFKFALDTLNYTNDHKADSAVVMNRRWKSEVLGPDLQHPRGPERLARRPAQHQGPDRPYRAFRFRRPDAFAPAQLSRRDAV